MDDIFEYLYEQRYKKGIVPTLDRIKIIYEKLNLKIKKNNVITIAGTNGKGSVSAILTSIFEHHGKKVCRFNSPHLYDITERFYFNGGYVEKNELKKILIKIKSVVDEYQNVHPYHFITFFEYMLLGALFWFSELDCDYIILEVGMGGRFDATNIIDAKFGIITSISYDHVSYLGDSIEKIAFEKAGIIKKNQICILGNLPQKAIEVIKKKALDENAELIFSNEVVLTDIKDCFLKGEYQKLNFKTAFSAAEKILKEEFDKIKTMEGIKKAYWPARYEKVKSNPDIIRDVAHNLEGIEFLRRNILKDYQNHKKIVLFSVMKDKDYKNMLSVIDSFSDFNVFTKIDNPRALPPEVLSKITLRRHEIENDPVKALNTALKEAENSKSVIIVTGSIFLMEYFKF